MRRDIVSLYDSLKKRIKNFLDCRNLQLYDLNLRRH